MKPKSDNLFHFTRDLAKLKSILQSGFMPRYCLEDVKWMETHHNFIGHPMVCFCDIPISRITEHIDFYGAYGLGMTKDWGLRNKLTPVLYAAPESQISKFINFLFEIDFGENPKKQELEDKTTVQIRSLLGLVKPITGQMQVGTELITKDFYQENEWRYVPFDIKMIEEIHFIADQNEANKDVESMKLTFSPHDIKYIFVKDDVEIPELVDFINNNFGNYPLSDVKILTTRILSLSTINSDL